MHGMRQSAAIAAIKFTAGGAETVAAPGALAGEGLAGNGSHEFNGASQTHSAPGLLSCFRVPWACMNDPYRAPGVIDEVPHASPACYLNLPPVHAPAIKAARGELAAKLPVPVISHTRPGAHVFKCLMGVAGRLAAQLLPARSGCVVAEPDVPLAFSSGPAHSLAAAWVQSAGSGTGPQSTGGVVSAARISGSAYASAVARHSRSRAASCSGAWAPLAAASARSEAN
jgi:hypothetical protein